MSDLPKTRAEALEIGSRHYETGKPCRNGHTAKRWTKSGICMECRRIFERTRPRADYRQSDKYKAYQKEYHKKYAETEHGKAVKRAANERYREKLKAEKGANNGQDSGKTSS
jgi:hypothetical protein